MKLLIPLSLYAMATAHSVTFVVGDGFALDGSGTFTGDTPNLGSNRDAAIDNAEVSTIYNVTQGTFTGGPFSSDPFIAGVFGNFGDGDVFRSETAFNLSGLPLSGSGTWVVTSIELFLEVAGVTFNNGVNDAGETVTVDVIPNADITAATLPAGVGSISLSDSDEDGPFDGEFFTPISIPTSFLDLNTDTSLSFVLDAGVNPTTAAMFGTGTGAGVGISGTDQVAVSPTLRINADFIPVPEPSVFSLAALAGLGLLNRRNRKA